jgi:hypothetical protein
MRDGSSYMFSDSHSTWQRRMAACQRSYDNATMLAVSRGFPVLPCPTKTMDGGAQAGFLLRTGTPKTGASQFSVGQSQAGTEAPE